MRLRRLAGTTVLTGQVTDQAHLLGLIEQIEKLGVELVSVNPDQETDGGAAGPGRTRLVMMARRHVRRRSSLVRTDARPNQPSRQVKRRAMLSWPRS